MDKSGHKIFALNLKYLRSSRKMSQQALADALGINRNKIASYESRNIEPSLDLILKFSSFFGVSVDDLLVTRIDDENAEEIQKRYEIRHSARNEIKTRALEKSDASFECFIDKTNRASRVYEGIKAYSEMLQDEEKSKRSKQLEEIIEYILDSNKELILASSKYV